MANWSLPTIDDLYTNVLGFLKERDLDLAKWLDPAKVTVSNPVADMVRWNSVSGLWERYTGSAWGALASTYNINVATASKWLTGRVISLTGDVTGASSPFDGSGNLSVGLTLATVNPNVGSFGSATSVPIISVDAKGRVTSVGTAALASMATQAANNVSITGGSISGLNLTLKQDAAAAPTVEGRVEWDTDNDQLKVGNGGATKTFSPIDGVATYTNKTFSTGCTWGGNVIPVNKGGTGAATISGLVKGNGTAAMSAAVAGTDYLAPGAIGATVQGYSAVLSAFSGISLAADKLYYGSSGADFASVDFDAHARTLLLAKRFSGVATFDSRYDEKANILGNISGNVAINTASGTYVAATVTGAVDFQAGGGFTNPAAAGYVSGFMLELTNGGASAITWPASVKWSGGSAPTLSAAGVDMLVFTTRDGGATWRGSLTQKDSK